MKEDMPGFIIKNKAGLSDDDLVEIEEKIFEYKSKLLDYRFTFNEEYFGIIYLLKLHEFLFGDLYDYAGGMSERYKDSDKGHFDKEIKTIVSLISSKSDVTHIANLINDLIDEQIFDDGNSRTIHLFFDNVINCYYEQEDDYAKSLKEEIKKSGRKL